MLRGFATAATAIVLVVAIALLDRDRDRVPLLAPIADAEAEGASAAPVGQSPSQAASVSFSRIGGCIGAEDLAGDVPPSPAFTPAGVERIAARVERLRQLRFDGPVEASFLSGERIEERIGGLVDRGYPASLAVRQGEALALLGAVPAGTDLLELTRSTLESQVIGLYLPERKELVVTRMGEAGALEAITLAHELEHALADDALGLPIPRRQERAETDADLAAHALVEGDATLTMELYALGYVALDEQLSLSGVAGEEDDIEELPDFLQRQLLYPYAAGFAHACELFAVGGWDAVDAAYEDPPASTVELLEPGPGPVELAEPRRAGRLPGPWRSALRSEIGAAELSWLFAAPGGDTAVALPDPEGAAAEWRGGEVELWLDEDRSALSVSFAEGGDGSLCGAVTAWYAAAFPDEVLGREGELTVFTGPERSGAIACEPGTVMVGIGPDPRIAASLASP